MKFAVIDLFCSHFSVFNPGFPAIAVIKSLMVSLGPCFDSQFFSLFCPIRRFFFENCFSRFVFWILFRCYWFYLGIAHRCGDLDVFERILLAALQLRSSVNRWAFGLLIPILDGVKLMFKLSTDIESGSEVFSRPWDFCWAVPLSFYRVWLGYERQFIRIGFLL